MSYSVSIYINTDELERIAAQLETKTDQVIKELAFEAEGNTKAMAPYDTGYLLSSIHTDPIEVSWMRISVDANYAIYQELGFTHYISGQFIQNPFLTPAIEMIATKFLSPASWAPLFA